MDLQTIILEINRLPYISIPNTSGEYEFTVSDVESGNNEDWIDYVISFNYNYKEQIEEVAGGGVLNVGLWDIDCLKIVSSGYDGELDTVFDVKVIEEVIISKLN